MLDMLTWVFIAAMTGCAVILLMWGIGISIYAVWWLYGLRKSLNAETVEENDDCEALIEYLTRAK